MLPEKTEWSLLVARFILGVLMLAHGIYKFQFIDFFVQAFELWWKLPGFLAYAVAFTEAFGGLFLILGIWVRSVSFAFIIIMMGAMAIVKAKVGLIGDGEAGYELNLAYMALAIVLAVNGSRKWSLSHYFDTKYK